MLEYGADTSANFEWVNSEEKEFCQGLVAREMLDKYFDMKTRAAVTEKRTQQQVCLSDLTKEEGATIASPQEHFVQKSSEHGAQYQTQAPAGSKYDQWKGGMISAAADSRPGHRT